MATNRKRIKRNFKIKLPSAMKEFLLYGTNSTDDFDVFLIKIQTDKIKEMWAEHKEELLKQWAAMEGQGKCFAEKIIEEEKRKTLCSRIEI